MIKMTTTDNINESKPIQKAILEELTGAYLQRKWDKIKHPSLKQRLKFLIAIYILAMFDSDVIIVVSIFIVEHYFKWVVPNAFINIVFVNFIALLVVGLIGIALVIKDKKRIK